MTHSIIDTFRKIKRKIQRGYINGKRSSEYSMQTAEELDHILECLKTYSCLFITHDNEGGTRAFEKDYIGKHKNVVVLRRLRYRFMEDLYFRLELKDINSGSEIYHLFKSNEIGRIFEYNYNAIIVNSLVTYQHYEELITMLVEYRENYPNCKIKYFVHDYHAVCPIENLHPNNDYCNMECNINRCNLCVGDIPIHIDEWRKTWNSFFNVIDEIRCFSNSSREIIQKAYPKLDDRKITVKPHDTSYCVYNPIENLEDLDLCIGIVGTIRTSAKGKPVVSDIIKRYGNRIPIRIIGTNIWRYRIIKRKVKYIGSYKRDELRKILINKKVSMVIFPSLCPETFSYLITELMAVDIPIICFNYGAQAEKIKNYHKGIVCANLEELYEILDKYAGVSS